MQPNVILAAIAMAAAIFSNPVLAGDREHGHDRDHARVSATRPSGGFDQGMDAVPHSAVPGERAYGWQYFSDPAARRAVVISPQGDYYYSHGKGLHWVAAAQTGV